MNYLLNKKVERNTFLKYAILIILLFVFIYFRAGIFRGLSYFVHTIFRSVLISGNNIGEKLSNIGIYFYSKKSLFLQNESLKSKLYKETAKIANYNSILAENLKIKEILGRKNENRHIILAGILSKPNQSPYDTLIIDIGARQGLQKGNVVFALGNVPIGTIAEAYSNSSKVVLFSNAGEKTQAVVSGKDVFVEIVGRGGGNFEMVMPLDFTLTKGDQIVLPGVTPYVLGIVEIIISDPRDPFIKALLVSPVNAQGLKFVEVELKK